MSRIIKSVISIFFFVIFLGDAFADDFHRKDFTRPDSHAPIGVMADHRHKQGEWMVSYRYHHMIMDTQYDGTHKISTEDVLDQFMVAPIDMQMQMHMLGAMYGWNDDLTLVLMLPFITKEMEHQNRAGRRFSTRSSGIGDLKFSGLFSLDSVIEGLQFNFGVSLPTGSIDKKDRTLVGPDQDLPYPMQLGSGTVDVLPGLTYMKTLENWSWGGQINSQIRLGRNNHNYRLGHRLGVTTWISRLVSRSNSVSLRLDSQYWGDIHGEDDRLNFNMVPSADGSRQAGFRSDLYLGLNTIFQDGFLKDHRLSIEAGAPVYQDLNGPQLGSQLNLMVGWQYAF